MRQRLRSNLTYANVMATLAVFLVLGGGTALGAFVVSNNSQIGPNTVSGHKPNPGQHANIIPGTLNAQDLAANAVTGPKIATNAVTGAKVLDNSLTGGDVGSLTGVDVTDNSLTGSDVNEASLGQVPSSNHAATADALGGISSDGFVQGVGSESSTIAASGAGFGSDALELANKGKLTLTCANPAQAESRYTNESGGSQRIFIDDGSGASTSQLLANGNATSDSQAGTSTDDARHTTYLVGLDPGILVYDVWMTNTQSGPTGTCAWFVSRRVIGVAL